MSNEAGGNAGAWACNAWHERTLDRLAAMINLACDETIPKTLIIGEKLMSCYAAMMCPSNPRSVMAVPYERKSGEAFNRDAGGSAPEALAMASCCQS